MSFKEFKLLILLENKVAEDYSLARYFLRGC